jgi:hypothetical protein
MTTPIPVNEALVVAARVLLDDARDEAAGLALMVEEATGYLAESGGLLAAIGTLDLDARLAALETALRGAMALLLRARDGRGTR